MSISLKSLIFSVDKPRVLAEFLGYIFDLEVVANNCDNYELIDSGILGEDCSLVFKKKTEKSKDPNHPMQEIVVAIDDEQLWEDYLKKIIFYLHQNNIGKNFSPSKQVRRPGGHSFHLMVTNYLKLEFFYPINKVMPKNFSQDQRNLELQ